jgi:NAD(P)-dependent dehydrogenase (short-subunit alcohol dehydrogenase family)
VADRFKGRIALVTGAATGIGEAVAARLAREGAAVIAGVADENQREQVATATAPRDALVLDVRSEADWKHAVAYAENAHGGLDILVNNAGIHRPGAALDTTSELWEEVMSVNLWGTFLGCRTAIPAMRRRGGGAIVNLSSINAITGVPGAIAYSVSKGGILTLTQALALAMEHVGDNIRVNCVCPGPVETPIVGVILDRSPHPKAAREAMAARQPMGRIAAPEEIAAVIAFLASADASFMTGLAVPVDGGRSVR